VADRSLRSDDRRPRGFGTALRPTASASVADTLVDVRLSNWSRTYVYGARRVHVPTTHDQLRSIVAGTPRIRVLGSRHSFTDIGDAPELLRLDALPCELAVDQTAGTVSLSGATRYSELASALDRQGMALANLASLPHISVAGSIATATHGSGRRNGNLATAVVALELVVSSGDVVTLLRGDHAFDGAVVGLGALGAVTRVTLEIEPAYEVHQQVFENVPWDVLLESFEEISAAGYSVSVFTRWLGVAETVWVKRRERERGEPFPQALQLARAATSGHHPIPGLEAGTATEQLGVRGAWSQRLPHFRAEFTPSSGDEIQSEYFVPFEHAVAAITAVERLGARVRPLLQVSELRTIAGDELWMSPQHGRDSLGIHFTWLPRTRAVEAVLVELEAALAPFSARPHWGKLFVADAATLAPLYQRRSDFIELRASLDPRAAFTNAWMKRCVLGTGDTLENGADDERRSSG